MAFDNASDLRNAALGREISLAKLAEWEKFYNYDRPHGAFNGKTPYETLKRLLG